VKSRSNPFL